MGFACYNGCIPTIHVMWRCKHIEWGVKHQNIRGRRKKNVGAGCPMYPDPNVDIHMQFQPYILMIMCPCLRSFREKNIIPRGEPSNDNHGSSDMIDMLIVIIYIIYNTNII